MMSYPGGSRPWHAWASVLLALPSAMLLVLFVLLVSDVRSASAVDSPDPIARAWGINSFGQLGDDSIAPRSKQVEIKVENSLGSLGNVSGIDGGQNHTVALKNGTVYAWGHNGSGQLGYDPNPSTSAREDSDIPGQVGGLTNVLAVAAGGNFSLALVSDGAGDNVANEGTVWAFGDNFKGQLGHGIPASSYVPVQVKDPGDLLDPNDDIVLEDVVAVAAGSAHSLAVKSDGTVWSWGYDGFGQQDGVSIPLPGATGNEVGANSIFTNEGLGIDLGDDGPTANDSGDPDVGANDLQNHPLISSSTTSASGATSVQWSFDSAGSPVTPQAYTVRFFSNPTDTDEGKTLVDTRTITDDSAGPQFFTSEFSPPRLVRRP